MTMKAKQVPQHKELPAVEGYLSTEEVGERFRTSKWTVRRWIDAGKLPAIRIGHQWLIPVSAVEQIASERTSPAAVEEGQYATTRFMRGPAPRYDYFQKPVDPAEADELVTTVIDVLRAASWPWDTFQIRPEGIRKMILGEEPVPPFIWRYLRDGIISKLQEKRDSSANQQ